MTSRRTLLLGSLATGLVRPAQATPEALQAAALAFTGGRTPQDGRVRLDIAELIDNGNAVPVTIRVQCRWRGPSETLPPRGWGCVR
jgi:sulfur-oxidizing protein SoxY